MLARFFTGPVTYDEVIMIPIRSCTTVAPSSNKHKRSHPCAYSHSMRWLKHSSVRSLTWTKAHRFTSSTLVVYMSLSVQCKCATRDDRISSRRHQVHISHVPSSSMLRPMSQQPTGHKHAIQLDLPTGKIE